MMGKQQLKTLLHLFCKMAGSVNIEEQTKAQDDLSGLWAVIYIRHNKKL
jgi:hypothetical protein